MTSPARRHIPELPPPDRITSALTGWTRQHWIGLADHLLAALRPYDSPLGARFDLPGRPSWSGRDCDGLEGFARSFLIAACRIAATEGEGCDDLIDRYASGLAAGADPDSPEAWPRITNGAQQMVEASMIAISLHESRPWLWDRLDERTRELVVGWLGGFQERRMWHNNWVLFQVVTLEFLASVGADTNRDAIEAGLDRVDDWHLGDGWYTDGGTQNFDHYNAFVLHPYPLLWARMAERSGVDSTDRVSRHRERLSTFLAQYQHLFGPDGAPVMFGRSMTYRMAMLAPFWMGALADASPLTPGQTRTLCSRVMRHWVERGVPDTRGLLSLGWHHRFLRMVQGYSGPGSPYWASLSFLGLLLPEDHAVWNDREARLPVDNQDLVVSMPVPGFLVHTTRHDQLVRMVNHGSDHAPPPSDDPTKAEPALDAQYGRYCSSNRTGPDLELSGGHPPIDNGVHLVAADGRVSRRGRIHRLSFGTDHAASWSPAIWPRPDEDSDAPAAEQLPVEVTSIVYGCHELRCIRLTADGRGQEYTAVAGGHAVADRTAPVTTQGTDHAGRPWAIATRSDGTTSAIWGLLGADAAVLRTASGANPFGPCSATPAITFRPVTGDQGAAGAIVVLLALTQETVIGDALPEVVRSAGPDSITVRLPGAPYDHEIRFGPDGPMVSRRGV